MPENWKDRLGTVYSTKENFDYDYDSEEEVETLSPESQLLKVYLDRKQRKGKSVTLIKNFIGTEADTKALGKELKVKFGVGGSIKNGEIIIQTDKREKIIEYLHNQGYKTKRIGG